MVLGKSTSMHGLYLNIKQLTVKDKELDLLTQISLLDCEKDW